jgi:hypothetical protein
MKFDGLSADQILNTRPIEGSSRHIFAAKAWLDNARRTDLPATVLYAAIELRYGIEYLLFECVVLTGFMTEERYARCLGEPAEMKRILSENGTKYDKLCDFYEALSSIEALPTSHRWNIKSLFKAWGMASQYLHWSGSHSRSHDQRAWRVNAIAQLEGVVEGIWIALTTTPGSGLMRPEGMKPSIRAIWDDYAAGKIDFESVIQRLRLLPWP